MQARTPTVWFYLGFLLALYGCLLIAGGAYQVIHPPSTVLADCHATLWAGIVLFVIGMAYLVAYWARRSP